MHVAVHAELQQNPSTQEPVLQSSAVVQVAPAAPLATQVPAAPGFRQ
jgi:hypothetical protein